MHGLFQAAARGGGGSAGLLQRGGSKRVVLAQVSSIPSFRSLRATLYRRAKQINKHAGRGGSTDSTRQIHGRPLAAFPARQIPYPPAPPPPPQKKNNQARLSSSAAASHKIGAGVFAPSDQFEGRHIGPSLEDEKVMLQTIGAFCFF